ncbi:uncharacterized protein E0L32_007003 [Thyridium curvatum]|uniref:Flavin reductase like domain-containing protein n=1 Tax=Thyridium curvatum TaxID=1093900 RepID=A0A507AZV5_9PEZI|nr:uncharacterized protein E0L32_007003 [Thyridium curvatum]TPX12356.1 hypothetical protein E0L32_007003 [Thyridium curvatum]
MKSATPPRSHIAAWQLAEINMSAKRKAEGDDQEHGDADEPSSPKRLSARPARSRDEYHNTQAGFVHYPPSKVYRLIEPGPVLLVTTGSLADSTHNIMTIGFHMVMQHESPPLIGIILGPWDASFETLKERKECVLAVPDVEMAEVVVDVGNCSSTDDDYHGADRDVCWKWEHFGLEPLQAARVKAPLVGGPSVIANIECVVEDTQMVTKYSMWVLRPVKAWINPKKRPGEEGKMFHHRGNGTFVVDGDIVDLQERMVKWQEYQH